MTRCRQEPNSKGAPEVFKVWMMASANFVKPHLLSMWTSWFEFSELLLTWNNYHKNSNNVALPLRNVSKRCRRNSKQYRPRSDCSSRSSLIWVYIVCPGLSVPKLRIITVLPGGWTDIVCLGCLHLHLCHSFVLFWHTYCRMTCRMRASGTTRNGLFWERDSITLGQTPSASKPHKHHKIVIFIVAT